MSELTLPPPQYQTIPTHSNWTFTQGLILGQASFILLCLIFIRYVVFSPAEAEDSEEWKKRREERAKKVVLSTTSVPPPPPSVLLQKTGYEMATHPAESTDWVNVLFAQILQGYRNDMLSHGGEEGARQKIERWLNPDKGNLSWLDPIRVTALSLGSAFPLLSNARIRPADGQGRIRAEIDMDYADTLSLSLATSVLINFPRPRFAVLPVSLGVELASIGGTLSVQIQDPVDGKQQLHVCLLPDFHLNLKTTTLLGSRAKLQDVPKLEQLIITRLRGIIQDRLVHPNHLTLSLPRLQSQSNSTSKPIVADFGEQTIKAMKEGLSQAAADLIHIEPEQLLQQQISQTQQQTQSEIGDNAMLSSLPSPPSSPPSVPSSNLPMGLGQKKITMPANFPGFSANTTPIPTPGGLGLNTTDTNTNMKSNLRAPSQNGYNSGRSTGYRPTSLHATSSIAPSQSQSQNDYRSNGHISASENQNSNQFRFRGQFASQPGTPRFGFRGLG